MLSPTVLNAPSGEDCIQDIGERTGKTIQIKRNAIDCCNVIAMQ
jgi:hypothetical protein